MVLRALLVLHRWIGVVLCALHYLDRTRQRPADDDFTAGAPRPISAEY